MQPPPKKPFKVTFKGQTLTFVIEQDSISKRAVVNGPVELIGKAEKLRARKVAVEIARSLGYLD